MAELGLKGLTDPALLERLHQLDPDCVFISGDDAMPVTHSDVLRRLATTVAIVAPLDPASPLTEPEWEHEIVQRWAHKMEEQPAGTIFRYGPGGGRRWVRRRRPPRMA